MGNNITFCGMSDADNRTDEDCCSAARLDQTVEELGQQFRNDLPQGEKIVDARAGAEVVQPHSEAVPPAVPPQFLPLPELTSAEPM